MERMKLLSKDVKIKNGSALTPFSQLYNETLDEASCTPDVILKIGPQKLEYYCHRLMLITASDFLRDVLATTNSGTIPVILIPDLRLSVIDYVLLYIYYGEVQVPADNYDEFVDACEMLQLKGQYKICDDDNVVEEEDIDDLIEEDYGDYDSDEMETDTKENVEENEENNLNVKNEINDWEEIIEVDIGTYDIPREKHPPKRHEITSQTQPNNVSKIEPINEPKRVVKIYKGSFQPYKPTQVTQSPKHSKFSQSHKKWRKFISKQLEATPGIKTTAQQSLILSVQRAYVSLGASITKKIKSNIMQSQILIENNKLIKGIHVCGFCDTPYNVMYRVSSSTGCIVYDNVILKNHLKKKHASELHVW